jgi:leucyl aminopeptidase
MEGSAVALGLLHAIHKNKEKINVELWLAITENRLSSTAYKSQDIITASNGVTIQTIHTDAEGRMVLADTLNLASKSKPKLMLDFATLTGACESALTDKYSGVFTNDENLHPLLIEAGRDSGERVWPFPMDNDYLELIDSDVADVKQCSESGGGDHILASKFLEKFVGKNIKWVHTDLSSGFTKGGLGHIPTRVTGFGINFGYKFLEKINLI